MQSLEEFLESYDLGLVETEPALDDLDNLDDLFDGIEFTEMPTPPAQQTLATPPTPAPTLASTRSRESSPPKRNTDWATLTMCHVRTFTPRVRGLLSDTESCRLSFFEKMAKIKELLKGLTNTGTGRRVAHPLLRHSYFVEYAMRLCADAVYETIDNTAEQDAITQDALVADILHEPQPINSENRDLFVAFLAIRLSTAYADEPHQSWFVSPSRLPNVIPRKKSRALVDSSNEFLLRNGRGDRLAPPEIEFESVGAPLTCGEFMFMFAVLVTVNRKVAYSLKRIAFVISVVVEKLSENRYSGKFSSETTNIRFDMTLLFQKAFVFFLSLDTEARELFLRAFDLDRGRAVAEFKELLQTMREQFYREYSEVEVYPVHGNASLGMPPLLRAAFDFLVDSSIIFRDLRAITVDEEDDANDAVIRPPEHDDLLGAFVWQFKCVGSNT